LAALSGALASTRNLSNPANWPRPPLNMRTHKHTRTLKRQHKSTHKHQHKITYKHKYKHKLKHKSTHKSTYKHNHKIIHKNNISLITNTRRFSLYVYAKLAHTRSHASHRTSQQTCRRK
jgi:hypothetical protein